MNRIDEAKCDFEKAVEYNPNFVMAYAQKCYMDYHFAMFNKDVVSTEAAVRDLERAFEKYSNPSECAHCYMLCAQVCTTYNFLRKVIGIKKKQAINYSHYAIHILIY